MSPRTALAYATVGVALVVGMPLRAVEKSSDDRTRYEFTSKKGNFKAVFPNRPPIDTEVEACGVTFHLTIAVNKGGEFAVAYFDLPPELKYETDEDIQKRMDTGREGALHMSRCKLVKETRLRLEKKYPGRDFTGESNDGLRVLRGRIYFVNGRVYELMIAGSKSFVDSADAQAFMASFWLLK